MAKLSEKFTAQHMALFALAGSMILLNLIDSIKSSNRSTDNTQEVALDGSHYRNPKLSWYQKIFCRGYKTSLNCGFPFLHPKRAEFEAEGKIIREGAARDGVIVYRGRLNGTKDPFRHKIEFDPNQ